MWTPCDSEKVALAPPPRAVSGVGGDGLCVGVARAARALVRACADEIFFCARSRVFFHRFRARSSPSVSLSLPLSPSLPPSPLAVPPSPPTRTLARAFTRRRSHAAAAGDPRCAGRVGLPLRAGSGRGSCRLGASRGPEKVGGRGPSSGGGRGGVCVGGDIVVVAVVERIGVAGSHA